MPRAIIVAGPNGAGKTTFATEYLPNEGGCSQFVNADLIAAGLSPFAPETADVAAGKAMLRRIHELVALKADFALETTLSGKWLLPRVKQWKAEGYSVTLFYLKLDSPEIACERVAARVKAGGHNIPEATIRRRFYRSLDLLEAYTSVVDEWSIYNNSGDEPLLEAWDKKLYEAEAGRVTRICPQRADGTAPRSSQGFGAAEKDGAKTELILDYHQIITLEPGKRGGRPSVRGMRITVADVLGWLSEGMSHGEIIDDYPELTEDDIRACLAFAADRERRLHVTSA